jgi:hypothetical protein
LKVADSATGGASRRFEGGGSCETSDTDEANGNDGQQVK